MLVCFQNQVTHRKQRNWSTDTIPQKHWKWPECFWWKKTMLKRRKKRLEKKDNFLVKHDMLTEYLIWRWFHTFFSTIFQLIDSQFAPKKWRFPITKYVNFCMHVALTYLWTCLFWGDWGMGWLWPDIRQSW